MSAASRLLARSLQGASVPLARSGATPAASSMALLRPRPSYGGVFSRLPSLVGPASGGTGVAAAAAVIVPVAFMSGRRPQPRFTKPEFRLSKKRAKRIAKVDEPRGGEPPSPVKQVYERLPYNKFADKPKELDEQMSEQLDRQYYDALTSGLTMHKTSLGAGAMLEGDEAAPVNLLGPVSPGNPGVVQPLALMDKDFFGVTTKKKTLPSTYEELQVYLAKNRQDIRSNETAHRNALRVISSYLTEKVKVEPPAAIEKAILLAKQTIGKIDVCLYTHLANSYGRDGNSKGVYNVIERTRADKIKPNDVMWTILMKSYFDRLRTNEGYACLKRMIREDAVIPSVAAFTTAMVHFGRYGTYMKVWDLYDQMLRLNVMPDTVTYSYLIYVATQEKYTEKALTLFADMKARGEPPSLLTYHKVMRACIEQPYYVNRCYDLVTELERAGLQPNAETVEVLLKACSMRGDLFRAIRLWDDNFAMDKDTGLRKKFEPTELSYFFYLSTCSNSTPQHHNYYYDEDMKRSNPRYLEVMEKTSPGYRGDPAADKEQDKQFDEDGQGAYEKRWRALKRDRQKFLNKKLAYLQDQARKAVEIIPSILLEIEGLSKDPNSKIKMQESYLYVAHSAYCHHLRPTQAAQVRDILYPKYGFVPNMQVHEDRIKLHGTMRQAEPLAVAIEDRVAHETQKPISMSEYRSIVAALSSCNQVDDALKWLVKMKNAYQSSQLQVGPVLANNTLADDYNPGLLNRDLKKLKASSEPTPAMFDTLWRKIAQLKEPHHLQQWHRVFFSGKLAETLEAERDWRNRSIERMTEERKQREKWEAEFSSFKERRAARMSREDES